MDIQCASSINVDTFRQAIKRGLVPKVSSVNEGLFGEYYFQVADKPATELVQVSCSVAKTKNPLNDQIENYLGLGLLSSEDGKNKREDLNLCIILDISGSMNDAMTEETTEDQGQPFSTTSSSSLAQATRTKLDIAKDVLLEVLQILNPQESVGIVLFDTQATTLLPMTQKQDLDTQDITLKLHNTQAVGGTSMQVGMELAIQLLQSYIHENKPSNKNNRILFLTDAQPNSNEEKKLTEMSALVAAQNQIYVTYIGIGLDFNTKMVNNLNRVRGTNCFGVHSAFQFKKILNEDFNYVVTPLCFNVNVSMQSSQLEIEKIYGAPDSSQQSSSVLHVETLMASALSKRGVKGGLILIKLREKERTEAVTSAMNTTTIAVSYLDKQTLQTVQKQYAVDFDAALQESLKEPSLNNTTENIFSQEGIRKGVLLARYQDTILTFIKAANAANARLVRDFQPPTAISNLVANCSKYMMQEITAIEDHQLKQELEVLKKCI